MIDTRVLAFLCAAIFDTNFSKFRFELNILLNACPPLPTNRSSESIVSHFIFGIRRTNSISQFMKMFLKHKTFFEELR